MTRIEKEVDKALLKLNISHEVFTKCSHDQSLLVINRAREKFIEDNPRVWWLSIKIPKKTIYFPQGEGYRFLKEYIPRNQKECWFIPVVETEKMLAYDAEVKYISEVLGECFYFEYYLFGKNFDWLIIENDHNEIIVSDLTESNF